MNKTEINSFNIYAADGTETAARVLEDELKSRVGDRVKIVSEPKKADFLLLYESLIPRDGYRIECTDAVSMYASGVRGHIYAIGMLLRKAVKSEKGIEIVSDIAGDYAPDKKIRGHQTGYRKKANTYEAWTVEDYRRYYLDMMFFGANTVEHIPYEDGVSKRNCLMKYDEEELLVEAAKIADEYDLDVSVWHPNNDDEALEQAAARRGKLYERVPRLNAVFVPGGDPGDFEAAELMARCKAISKELKRSHPEAEMWPSAQQPHSKPHWGKDFIAELEKSPEGIDGVITGPNKAFELDELRRIVPEKYPIRFYPDITHNVRCEYPVHFDRDDWHFALTAALSRECTNPRPREYRHLHRLTSRYVVGSVSYSEGVNDDVNKFVWSDMDYFPDCNLRTTLLDYSRLFFFGAPAEDAADGIFGLELNWECDPAENPCIDATLAVFERLAEKYPFLNENWRFVQLLMRAKCDFIIRRRRIFELDLISRAKRAAEKGDLARVRELLEAPYDERYLSERSDISALAKKLFELIGMQLDIEHYHADGWERGAVLETIDLPVTDRKWLLGKLDYAETLDEPAEYMRRMFERNTVEADEYYFSVALNGLSECGFKQSGEIYMNFQGDRPQTNNGSIPTALFNIYDNLSFRCKIGGLTAPCDYVLTVSYADSKIENARHRISVNGHVIYEGEQFGGEANERYDAEMLRQGLVSASYTIPRDYICNGCIDLEMSEPTMGIMFAEFRITKKKV